MQGRKWGEGDAAGASSHMVLCAVVRSSDLTLRIPLDGRVW